jgi:hypothetical protein
MDIIGKNGVKRFHITAQMTEEVDAVNKKHGYVDESLLLEASKKPGSALHELAHWDDDAEMARLGRLEIFRSLIRRIRVTDYATDDSPVKVSVRGYYGFGDGSGYHDVDTVLSTAHLRAMTVKNALRDAQNLERKYRHMRDLSAIFAGSVAALEYEVEQLDNVRELES